MRRALASFASVPLMLGVLGAGPAWAVDESKVRQGSRQVESGAKQVAEGVVGTAKGVGKTVVGGAGVVGEKIKEAGQAAKPASKRAWGNVRGGVVSFGHNVKTFFTRLFGDSFQREMDEKGKK
ncbi:MAG: hypothetical protein HYR50_00875 [Candidatus Rokubacteria bacterium]|nr:hypothetical protein [Candidatus Rokubacteria bacterium]